jgi:hypothetical protein
MSFMRRATTHSRGSGQFDAQWAAPGRPLNFDEIQPLFDAIKAKRQSIHTTGLRCALLLQDAERRLDLSIVLAQRVHPLAQTTQIDEGDAFSVRLSLRQFCGFT